MTTREQQSAYLQAMDIQAWVPRYVSVVETGTHDALASDAAVSEVLTEITQAQAVPSELLPANISVAESASSVAPVSEPLSSVRSAAGPEAGLVDSEEPPLPTDDYMPGLDMSEVEASAGSGASSAKPPAIHVETLDWPALQSAVSVCTACDLHLSRAQTVFGVGNHVAEWMVIGEAPGSDEDQQGEPFVGPSGKLLNNMLRALGLQREQVFISNILKCRPPGDRDPLPAEIAQCEPYLQRQIALVAPKVILAMGAVAAHSLLKVNTPVTKLRGQLHHYGETPVVVTYHPAYLLHKPSEKAKSWQDLRFAASVLQTDVAANPGEGNA